LSTSSSQLISIAVVYGTPSYKWKRIFGSGAIRNEEKVPSAELKQQKFKKPIKTQKKEKRKRKSLGDNLSNGKSIKRKELTVKVLRSSEKFFVPLLQKVVSCNESPFF